MERRNTIQKELVRAAVLTLHRHVTADEVYEYLHKDHPSIGKGTVYRNLAILSEEGLIRRVEIPNGPDRYDFTVCKHYHVRCVNCGDVQDVDLDDPGNLEERVRNDHGIKFLTYDILFKGICRNCQAEDEESAKK